MEKIDINDRNQNIDSQQKTNYKTKIIVFEGIDGAGKTTQIKILKKFFDKFGFSYFHTREPGGSDIGEEIRSILLNYDNISIDSQILLCTASRKEHLLKIEELIKNNQYDYIIFDRFIDSTLAYQIIPNKLNPEILYSLNRKFKINLKIDLAILLDIEPNYSFSRRRNPSNHFDKNIEYLKKVRIAYIKIWKKHKEGQNNYNKRVIIQSASNPKIVFRKILYFLKIYNILDFNAIQNKKN